MHFLCKWGKHILYLSQFEQNSGKSTVRQLLSLGRVRSWLVTTVSVMVAVQGSSHWWKLLTSRMLSTQVKKVEEYLTCCHSVHNQERPSDVQTTFPVNSWFHEVLLSLLYPWLQFPCHVAEHYFRPVIQCLLLRCLLSHPFFSVSNDIETWNRNIDNGLRKNTGSKLQWAGKHTRYC